MIAITRYRDIDISEFTELPMSESIDKELIRQVLKRRENKGASKKIAALVGVKQNTLSMWLHDRSPSSHLDNAVPEAMKLLKLKMRRAA